MAETVTPLHKDAILKVDLNAVARESDFAVMPEKWPTATDVLQLVAKLALPADIDSIMYGSLHSRPVTSMPYVQRVAVYRLLVQLPARL